MRLVAGWILAVLSCLPEIPGAQAQDVSAVVARLEQRYASVKTVTGSFQQSYRAPGINQSESGTFWLKKPGLMRWEYRQPEEKLFIANEKESYLYVPFDRQVTIQDFNPSDLYGTPLELLLGAGGIHKNFTASWEADIRPKTEKPFLIRLEPRGGESTYSFLVLELDRETCDVRRIVIREKTGNTSEFLLTDMTTNVKIEHGTFQFKIPKGIEVVRLTGE
jgi:outer membrane lipoprotein carrier protein